MTMKKTITFVLFVAFVLAGLLACSNGPESREKAAVIGDMDFTFCGYCGGWFVLVDSVRYRAQVAESFRGGNTPVWIRFKKDESDGGKVAGRWIIITSIRERK